MNHPDVSVLIPTYNRQGYLRQALESCFTGNDGIHVEVIVVDDGSTDGTRDYLRSLDDPRVKVLFQNQEGPQVARNRGMKQVQGRYFKQLDDDDYLLPGSLQAQVEALDQADKPVCYGDPLVLDQEEGRTRRRECPAHSDLLVAITSGHVPRWNLIFLLDSELAKRCSWDESLRHLHILSYLLKFCTHDVRCVNVDTPVAVHRIHDGPRVSHWAQGIVEEREREFNMYLSFLEGGDVDSEQRTALLHAMWLQAHMIAPYDWDRSRSKIEYIVESDPGFEPRRSSRMLHVLDRLLDPYKAERLINPLRKISKTFSMT